MEIDKKSFKNKINFLFTADGSAGLYNMEVDDVYHSVYGAKSEAIEKFIIPLDFEKIFFNRKELKILDICYGIGYNTKALIKKIIETKYIGNVEIDLLEYNLNLILVSPFIKDGFFKTYPEVSYALIQNLLHIIYENKDELCSMLNKSTNKKFYEPFYRHLIKKFKNFRYNLYPREKNNAFLHNIYYHCISHSMKNRLKYLKNKNFVIIPHIGDARQAVKELSGCYDIVFLDAFTPAKQPLLWTLDFFKELYRVTKKDCMILTYSNSSSVRHAMLESGFFVGKLFDKENRSCGTCASKNQDYIKNKLDDFDLGLMKTSAGVYYIDKNLNSSNDEILKEHEMRKQQLQLESSSQFIKRYKNNQEHLNEKI